MTVIAACVRNGKAAMASDALGSMNDLALPGRRKLFDCGDAMLGFAGSITLLRPIKMLPACQEGREEDFCYEVAGAVRQFVADHGLDKDEYYCFVVVASLNGIWLVLPDGGVEKVDGEYWAVGSGGEVALGAMYALDLGGAEVDTMVEMGVRSACDLTLSCGGDVTILEMPKEKEKKKAKR